MVGGASPAGSAADRPRVHRCRARRADRGRGRGRLAARSGPGGPERLRGEELLRPGRRAIRGAARAVTRALITGISGQDGSYLAELLLEKGYEVNGLVHGSTDRPFERLESIADRIELFPGDLLDEHSLVSVLRRTEPDEIYNLAALSSVAESWRLAVATAEYTAVGVTRLLEGIRETCPEARFYQASTSEMFGKAREVPQTESTPFYPRSPYGVAKVYGYWICVNYREAYGFHASNGILFNHESPLRGETFVTRKITRAVARMALGLQDCLYLGNLDARRDWGHARDYVEMQWLMLQQDRPEDFVIATGVQHSVREFIEFAAAELGMRLAFDGEGAGETARVVSVDTVEGEIRSRRQPGDVVVRVDPRYYRPT